MSKEWKCADCCCFGTDACHFPSMEAHYIACEHLCVDHNKAYQQGRADAIKDHQEQCNGKCFKCDLGGFFVNSDGREVKLPYSYSYKVGCDDERYIDIEQVAMLIDKARADAIDEFAELLCQYVYDKDFMSDDVIRNIAEQLKEQENENNSKI